MRIAVIGAGGVGGYFGARLAAAGEEVIFVQRGAHLEAMRRDGLIVRSRLGDVALETVQATDDPSSIGPVDIVLVTVKSTHTEAAGEAAKHMLGADTAVISLQNGVENEARLAEIVGRDHVLGGVAYILSLIEEPGVIVHAGPFARIVFGELDGVMRARSEAFLAAALAAQIEAEYAEDVDSALWTKFVNLCPHNGLTALMRTPIGVIRTNDESRALLSAATDEMLALARAMDIALPERITQSPMQVYDNNPYAMTSSLHYDLTHGKPLELEWLNGAVVRLGRANNVATPVNSFIYQALHPFMNGPAPEQE